MFSVGIFTTHIPYVAMIAFYAFFLLFGAENNGANGVRVAEKTVTAEHHLGSFGNGHAPISNCYHYQVAETISPKIVLQLNARERQGFPGCDINLCPQKPFGNHLFSRPPPATV